MFQRDLGDKSKMTTIRVKRLLYFTKASLLKKRLTLFAQNVTVTATWTGIIKYSSDIS